VGANDTDTLRHELAHALYYTDKSYREKIDSIFKRNAQDLDVLKKFILNKGYHFDVLHDELQAYIIDNDDFCLSSVPKKLIRSIHRLYNIHTESKNET